MNAETTQTAIHETELAITLKKRYVELGDLMRVSLDLARHYVGAQTTDELFDCLVNTNSNNYRSPIGQSQGAYCTWINAFHSRHVIREQLYECLGVACLEKFEMQLKLIPYKRPELFSSFERVIEFLTSKLNRGEYFTDNGHSCDITIRSLMEIYIAILMVIHNQINIETDVDN